MWNRPVQSRRSPKNSHKRFCFGFFLSSRSYISVSMSLRRLLAGGDHLLPPSGCVHLAGLMQTKASQCSGSPRSVKWSEKRAGSPIIQRHKIFKSTIIGFWEALLEPISVGDGGDFSFFFFFNSQSSSRLGRNFNMNLGPTTHRIYTVNGTKSLLSSQVETYF